MRRVIISFASVLLGGSHYISTTAYSSGDLNAHHIAGIWRLKSKQSFLPRNPSPPKEYPLKEFTVVPLPKARKRTNQGAQEILLLLREDGKYAQYQTPSKNRNKLTLSKFKQAEEDPGVMEGTWALVDGKLVLAADRPKQTNNIRSDGHKHDTILEGRVICTSGDSLLENPALLEKKQSDASKSYPSKGAHSSSDVHLSVPKGKVKVGKFFYPLHHPSFFDQPIFNPMKTGSFELEQILGTLNTQYKNPGAQLEKFKKKDLMDKRYYLTSFPLPAKRKKRQRWSIKYNKFVDDKPKSEAEQEREEREKNMPIPIRTFEVDLFANNTFQTVAGYGDDLILRGKWSIIGNDRDQLWMYVWRFGFGRSVSGSTFSEGRSLSQKDEVAYWGEIYEVDASNEEDSIDSEPMEWKGTRIEINGSVMQGVGLEPCSIARFTMIEKTEEDYDFDDDDDEEEEGHEDDDDDFPLLKFDIGSFE